MVTLGVAVAAILVVALVPLLRWLAYLRFCRWLVSRSNDPSSLRDAAVAARAVQDSTLAALAQAVAKLAVLLRRSNIP